MQHERCSLRSFMLVNRSSTRSISDDLQAIGILNLDRTSCLDAPLEKFRGRTVLLATRKQLPTVRALIALDGIARRILIATPDLEAHLPWIISEADVNNVVADANDASTQCLISLCRDPVNAVLETNPDDLETEWVLFTSGTTGRPKMVVHTLSSLTGPLDDGIVLPNGVVWSTFYDVRRYGGLQILFRALIAGGSLVLSDAEETVTAFLKRLAAARVTHISGTPSHWRKALMSGAGSIMQPNYIRLSGEVADQPLLDNLRRAFPNANIAHAFASTEAGVAFEREGRLVWIPRVIPN